MSWVARCGLWLSVAIVGTAGLVGCGGASDETSSQASSGTSVSEKQSEASKAPKGMRAEVGILIAAQRSWENESKLLEAEVHACWRENTHLYCAEEVFIPGEEEAAENLKRNVGGILYNERVGPKCEHALRLLLVGRTVGLFGADDAITACETELG
jgi:hypothetical protein